MTILPILSDTGLILSKNHHEMKEFDYMKTRRKIKNWYIVTSSSNSFSGVGLQIFAPGNSEMTVGAVGGNIASENKVINYREAQGEMKLS